MSEKIKENLESFGATTFLPKLENEQKEVLEAVQNTGLKGAITITLNYRRVDESTVEITPSIKSKIPKRKMKPVEMFVDRENNLHEEDPDQMTFENVKEFKSNKNVNFI